MNVFLSPFKNPFINLALEDHFLRGGADLPLAFFYINRPCVVMGRFQNPWLECQLPYLVEKDIWPVRRQSGGGTVFHDEGNLNFSFITPDSMINRRKHAELIQRAFARADIQLEISERHDLWLNGRKISGSAFKQTKDGSFHHGTFLVSSDLTKLEESLKHTFIPKETKSIASVRSKVISLNEVYPEITIEEVIELITDEIGSPVGEVEGTVLSHPQVFESFEKLRSWEWLWGETPYFEIDGMEVNKGQTKKGKFDRTNFPEYQNLFPNFSKILDASKMVF